MVSITIFINDKCKRDSLKEVLTRHGWTQGERPEVFESVTAEGLDEVRDWIRNNNLRGSEQVTYTDGKKKPVDLAKIRQPEMQEVL